MPFKYGSVRERLNANSKEFPKPEGEHYAELKNPCRIWQGVLNNSGYGKFNMRTRRRDAKGHRKVKHYLAHRVSLADALGIPVWRLNNVCHACDNKPCIEPEHLRSFTQGKNVREAVKRERHRNGTTGKLVEPLGAQAF